MRNNASSGQLHARGRIALLHLPLPANRMGEPFHRFWSSLATLGVGTLKTGVSVAGVGLKNWGLSPEVAPFVWTEIERR